MRIPFQSTPSIDAVIGVAKSAASEHPYKQVRLVMYSPVSGQSRFQRLQRGAMIQLRDRGYYPLGLFGWYDKDQTCLQPVAHIFPWLQDDELAGEIFAMICDAETARVQDLYEKRDLN
jgi:hypothetical protein